MSKKRKVKTIKEFVEQGPPQFEPLMYKEYFKSKDNLTDNYYNFDVCKIEDDGTEKYASVKINLSDERIAIKKVRRLSDLVIFSAHVAINIKNRDGYFYVIEFSDDLIHCIVFDVKLFIQNEVEVNDLETKTNVIGMDGEKYECEDDEEYEEEERKERESDWVNI